MSIAFFKNPENSNSVFSEGFILHWYIHKTIWVLHLNYGKNRRSLIMCNFIYLYMCIGRGMWWLNTKRWLYLWYLVRRILSVFLRFFLAFAINPNALHLPLSEAEIFMSRRKTKLNHLCLMNIWIEGITTSVSRVNTLFNKANQKKLPIMQLGSHTNIQTCNEIILCNNFTELKIDVSNSFLACTSEKH